MPEPELMDDAQQALAYAQADFSDSNQSFVDIVKHGCPAEARLAVDIGCGPGDVDLRLARAVSRLRITAVDGSAPMIALARDAVGRARLDDRITLIEARLPALPLEAGSFDAVLSKDLLHHLPEPEMFWTEIVRLGRPGAAVFVMDLMRPATEAAAHAIVDSISGEEDPILREDFYNSLCAAFTPEEVAGQLAAAGLDLRVEPVSSRHMLVRGHLP